MKVVVDINALPCKNGKDCTECAFYSVESICEIPTALQSFPKYEDQRPHGEWIFKNGKYRCTACGERAIYRYNGMSTIPKEIITDFCPNCGADMRGKTE